MVLTIKLEGVWINSYIPHTLHDFSKCVILLEVKVKYLFQLLLRPPVTVWPSES